MLCNLSNHNCEYLGSDNWMKRYRVTHRYLTEESTCVTANNRDEAIEIGNEALLTEDVDAEVIRHYSTKAKLSDTAKLDRPG